MVETDPQGPSRSAPSAHQAAQAAAAAPQASVTAETAEGEVMTRAFRDALIVGLAQNLVLVGLVILAAGVPTW